MRQNIEATLNRAMNNRTTNNRTISVKIIISLPLGDYYASFNIHSHDQAIRQLGRLTLSNKLNSGSGLLKLEFLKGEQSNTESRKRSTWRAWPTTLRDNLS